MLLCCSASCVLLSSNPQLLSAYSSVPFHPGCGDNVSQSLCCGTFPILFPYCCWYAVGLMALHMPTPVPSLWQVLMGSSCRQHEIHSSPFPVLQLQLWLSFGDSVMRLHKAQHLARCAAPAHTRPYSCPLRNKHKQPTETSRRPWWKPLVLIWENILRFITGCTREDTYNWEDVPLMTPHHFLLSLSHCPPLLFCLIFLCNFDL